MSTTPRAGAPPRRSPPARGRARAPRLAGGAVVAFAALSGASPGCSVVVDGVIEQCATDADCAAKGGDFGRAICRDGACRSAGRAGERCDGDAECRAKGGDFAQSICRDGACRTAWSCVEGATAAFRAGPERIKVGFRFTDILTETPVGDFQVSVCEHYDFGCQRPSQPAPSDETGRAEVELSTAAGPSGDKGFDGHFLITSEGRPTFGFTIYPPLVNDLEDTGSLFDDAALQGFSSLAKEITFDPALGILFMQSYDCLGREGAGVTFHFEGDNSAEIFYGVDGIPSRSATATDGTGTAYAFNLPEGTLTLRAEHPEVGVLARLTVGVRPGQLSSASIRFDL